MTNKKIILISLLNALGTAVYILAIALFFRNIQKIFGNKPDTFLAPLSILLLFVLSAAITAALVLGRPILLYVENQKPEAIKMFFYTIGWLFLITIILFLTQIIK